jgi:inhibitor of cysteine peptidase
MGGSFTIMLRSNPTTGYSWEPEFDEVYVQLIDKSYTAPPSELVGAEGNEVFKFFASKSGETIVKFHYLRPWEGEAVKTLEYKIMIGIGI